MNQGKRSTFDTVSTVLVCVAAAFVVWAQVEARWLKQDPAQQVQDIQDLDLKLGSDVVRYARGESDIILIEFTDYECPFCGRHAREVGPTLKEINFDSRLLRQAVLHYPLEQVHQRARAAAVAAECSGRQGRFWEMHDRLFGAANKLNMNDLVDAARTVGLDVDQFSRCLVDDGDVVVASDISEGRRLGVTSTPTFFIGRVAEDGSVGLTTRIRGILSAEEMKRVLASGAALPAGPSLLTWLQRWAS